MSNFLFGNYIIESLRRCYDNRMLKNGIPFDYREKHPDLFSEEAMKRMIDELDARSAMENLIDVNGNGGDHSVAGSNESESAAGRAARCRELPGRSRAAKGWERQNSFCSEQALECPSRLTADLRCIQCPVNSWAMYAPKVSCRS